MSGKNKRLLRNVSTHDNEASSTTHALLSLPGLTPGFWQMLRWDRFKVYMKWLHVFEYFRAKHDTCNCCRLISQVSSQFRLWPWIYHKNLNCWYWNEIINNKCQVFFLPFCIDNRWMLSFSSILNEIVKVQSRPYTAVKFMLKTFDIHAFADPRHIREKKKYSA